MDFKPRVDDKSRRGRGQRNQDVSRRIRNAGPYPCSSCGTQCMSRRNRRRHIKLRHPEPRVISIPSINGPKCSADSKAEMSRSAAAKREREAKNLEEMLIEEIMAEEINEFEGKNINEEFERAFVELHEALRRKKKLCNDKPCTDATAMGTRKIPQRLLVRERRPVLFCSICFEQFTQNGALRSHVTSIHNTKQVIREAYDIGALS